jgi:hypothetical protein
MSSDQFSDFFGMAGHLAAMSEFLLRGYNVAIPFVDRGDDVLTLEGEKDEVRRVQVKTSKLYGGKDPSTYRLEFNLRSEQLRRPDGSSKLFYMFMFRPTLHWEWILLSRQDLAALRRAFETSESPSVEDTTSGLSLRVWVDAQQRSVRGWNADLHRYFNAWVDWPETGRCGGNFGR